MSDNKELAQFLSAKNAAQENILLAEKIHEYLVEIPLEISAYCCKTILSHTLGIKRLLHYAYYITKKIYGLLKRSRFTVDVDIITLHYKIEFSGLSISYKYSNKPAHIPGKIILPLIYWNFFSENLGKIIGWALASLWAIPMHIIIKTILWTVNLYFEIKAWHNLRRINKVALASAMIKRKISSMYSNEVLPYLTQQGIQTAMKDHFFQALTHQNLKKQRSNNLLFFHSYMRDYYNQRQKGGAIVRTEITENEYNKNVAEKNKKDALIELKMELIDENLADPYLARKLFKNICVPHKSYVSSGKLYYQYAFREQYEKQITKISMENILQELERFNKYNSKNDDSHAKKILKKMEIIHLDSCEEPWWNPQKLLFRHFLSTLIFFAYECNEMRKCFFYINKNFKYFSPQEKQIYIHLIHKFSMQISEPEKNSTDIPETREQKNARIKKMLAALSFIPKECLNENDPFQRMKMRCYEEILLGRIDSNCKWDDLKKNPNFVYLENEINQTKSRIFKSRRFG